MKVYIKGTNQTVDLTQKNYAGGGGEGDVYVIGSVAYKVYNKSAKMIPVGKIHELSVITDPIVIKPDHILLDGRSKPIGYTMRFVKDALALCQLFPRSFRDRNKITGPMIVDLVHKFQDGVKHVHDAQILIVDLNEMNFLANKKFNDLYFIDTDSYQTKSYPATAIMPSIRDWKTPLGKFNENSDWFSFGIVSFQMFVGIHPFKGKHPDVHGFEDRMKANISIYNKDVSVPAAAYPLSVIPKEYNNWYKSVFEKGERCPPPDKFGVVLVAAPVIKTLVGSKLISIEELGDYQDDVLRVCGNSKNLTVVTASGVWFNTRKVMDVTKKVTGIGFSTNSNVPVLFTGGERGDISELTNLNTRDKLPFGVQSFGVESYDGRTYMKLLDHIYEVVLLSAGKQVIASATEAAQVLEHATTLYPGVAIQKLLGATYTSLFIASGMSRQIQIKELDGYRILDAKFDNGVLMVIGEKKGKYDRLVFRIDQDGTYDVRVIADIATTGLNFVALDSGVCVSINEEGHLELFSNKKGSSSIKVIKDNAISGDMLIGECRDCVVVAYKHKVYKLSMNP